MRKSDEARARHRRNGKKDEALQRGCESERGLESKSGEGDESEKELQSFRASELQSDGGWERQEASMCVLRFGNGLCSVLLGFCARDESWRFLVVGAIIS